MIEQLLGLKEMSILQCQAVAKKIGFDSITFDLVGPTGRIPCKWLDAYMGLFQIIGKKGMLVVGDFEFETGVYCENVIPEAGEE